MAATGLVMGAGAAQTQWSAAYWIGLHRSPSAVVQYKLGTLPDVFGHKSWSLDVYSFAGAQINNQALLAGVDLGHSFNLAANCQGFLGVGLSYGGGLKPNPGIVAGISVQV